MCAIKFNKLITKEDANKHENVDYIKDTIYLFMPIQSTTYRLYNQEFIHKLRFTVRELLEMVIMVHLHKLAQRFPDFIH